MSEGADHAPPGGLSSFLANFKLVSPAEAAAALPSGSEAVYVLYAEGDPCFYFGRTKNPLGRAKAYLRGQGSSWRGRAWFKHCKENGIKIKHEFLIHTPAVPTPAGRQNVRDVEDSFIVVGKELDPEHCLNFADGTRPLSEVILEACGKAISEAKKGQKLSAEHRRKISESWLCAGSA